MIFWFSWIEFTCFNWELPQFLIAVLYNEV
jgi:hypothetical protein